MTSLAATALSPLQSWLADAPEAPAFRIDDTVITRTELLRASDEAAHHLHALGFRRGDVLALLVPDSAVWLQFLFAASRIGVLVVPISTRYRDLEIKHMLSVSRAKGIVVVRRFLKSNFLAIVESLATSVPHLEHVIALESTVAFFRSKVALGDEPLPGPYPDALLCTFSTSGTTGHPKLAAHSQSSIARHAATVAERLEINAQTMTLCALPLYGVLGFVCAMATLARGGCCVSQPVFNAAQAAQIIDRQGITHFYGSDGLLDAALRIPGHEFQRLRRGGFAEFAGLGRRLIDFAEREFGLRLGGVYGSSECFALMAVRDPDLPAERRALPGGHPTSSEIRFRIADPITGAQLADGEPGELQISGPNVMAGYLNNPDATAAVMTADGWFRTGDLAYGEHETFVFLARMNDSLRLRGYLVDPTEIEAFLMEHEDVDSAQVVGIRREGRGDVAVAFIVLRAGVSSSEQELITYCSNGIANYKVPSRIVFVDTFPQIAGPNGVKVQKNKLRELAEVLVD